MTLNDPDKRLLARKMIDPGCAASAA